MWKRVVIGVVGIGIIGCAGLLGYGATRPTTWHVERSAVVDAAPEDIHPLLEDLEAWPRWAGGAEADAAGTTYTYGPVRKGAGATYSWSGPGSFGTVTLTGSDPGGVTYDMVMEESATPAHGSLRLTPEAGGTRVTWTDEGDFGIPVAGGLMAPMMESALGPHFEGGLARLGALATTNAAARKGAEAERATTEAAAVATGGAATGEAATPPIGTPAGATAP